MMVEETKMNKAQADILCTSVVLGFVAKKSEVGFFRKLIGSKPVQVKFEYDKEKDKPDYETVKKCFEKVDINDVIVALSTIREKLPLIATIGKVIWTKESAGIIADKEVTLSETLNKFINDTKGLNGGKDLYGCYVGGYSTISKVELLGASDLEMYKPEYRDITDKELEQIYKTYNLSKLATETIEKALEEYVASANNKNNEVKHITRQAQSLGELQDYSKRTKKLFKSYHGMIRAIVRYSGTDEKNTFIFELATGPITNKVSSCFPCAAFMEAVEKPATSIHLGRGDYWNIPNSNGAHPISRRQWEEKITKWCLKGLEVLRKKDIGKEPFFGKCLLEGKKNNKYIPDRFLEALTFEGSFTKKIINTIKLP